MEPLISVIVPVYNVEPYLHKCVDSILNQTYRNLEVILVDDGSPDGCPAICDEYAEKDERVKVIHKKNGGLSDARNAGMAVAKGEYLSFVDSDDMLSANAIEILLRFAHKEDADLVIGGYNRFENVFEESINEETSVQCWTPVEAMADMLKNGCASWARLYRRELHQSILFPVGEINEDEAIVLHILDHCSKIVRISAVVYYYRCRTESITTAAFNKKKTIWIKHCLDNLKFIQTNYPELEPYAAARYRDSLLWILREIALSNDHFDAVVVECRAELKRWGALFMKSPFHSTWSKLSFLIHRWVPFWLFQFIMRIRQKIR